jgi:hypothetical protein
MCARSCECMQVEERHACIMGAIECMHLEAIECMPLYAIECMHLYAIKCMRLEVIECMHLEAIECMHLYAIKCMHLEAMECMHLVLSLLNKLKQSFPLFLFFLSQYSGFSGIHDIVAEGWV